jgi:hypothetical protein
MDAVLCVSFLALALFFCFLYHVDTLLSVPGMLSWYLLRFTVVASHGRSGTAAAWTR